MTLTDDSSNVVAAITAGLTAVTQTRIESALGGGGADTIHGSSGRNRLDGGLGNDLLDGGTGADRMLGGNGDDLYLVDSVDDRVMWDADGTGAGGSALLTILSAGLSLSEADFTVVA